MSTYTITYKPGFRKSYTVTDAYGAVIYQIRQSFRYLTSTFVVTDAAGEPVAKIRQQISLIVPAYTIELPHTPPIHVRQKLCFGVRFTMQGKPWTMVSDKACQGYYVLDEKEEILYDIRKNYQRRREEYILDPRQQAPLPGICLTIVADSAKRAIAQA